jgi:hypothetical protein
VVAVTIDQTRYVGDDSREVARVRDHAVFDDFRESGAKLLERQGDQRLRVREHGGWLMKRADQILSRRRIDARLSANRRVHHCQERRRDLNVGNPAHERRRNEPGEIPDDAATERDDRTVATEAVCEQRVGDVGPRRSRLLAFPGGNRDDTRWRAERSGNPIGVLRPDLIVGHDGEAMSPGPRRRSRPNLVEQSRLHAHSIRAQLDVMRRVACHHQVTSPTSARRFARRARVNRRSDSRFR